MPKAYLTITIDVEPDCSPSWHYSDPLTFSGVEIGIRERLQPLFNRYDAAPTYLINNVVLEDNPSINIFKTLEGKFELGSHLHEEFIEPEKRFDSYAGVKAEGNQSYLPPDVERAKLESITHLFEQRLGYWPRSFRAGRYSANENTIQSLLALGYYVDTSVTPHTLHTKRDGSQPVDHRTAPEQPYFISDDSILKPCSSGKMLEVPISIKKTYPIRRLFRPKPIWLRPVYSTVEQATKLIRSFLHTYRHNEYIVLNLMFHNVEVMAGKSPYTKSEEEVHLYLDFLREILVTCQRHDVQSVTLSELYQIYTQK